MTDPQLRRRYARYALATIRLANGVAGLEIPEVLAKRLDPSREPSPAAIYAFRLFWYPYDPARSRPRDPAENEQYRLAREAVVIHGSDVLTVVTLAARHQLPPRTAATIGLKSTVNVALALASPERPT
jgi:hypothetical protein